VRGKELVDGATLNLASSSSLTSLLLLLSFEASSRTCDEVSQLKSIRSDIASYIYSAVSFQVRILSSMSLDRKLWMSLFL
jgi:hypothetical protein